MENLIYFYAWVVGLSFYAFSWLALFAALRIEKLDDDNLQVKKVGLLYRILFKMFEFLYIASVGYIAYKGSIVQAVILAMSYAFLLFWVAVCKSAKIKECKKRNIDYFKE